MRIRILHKRFIAAVIVCVIALMLAGCATLFNKSSELEIHVRNGTTVLDDSGPIVTIHKYDSSSAFIRLSNDRPQRLQFDYFGKQQWFTLTPQFESKWLVFDFFSTVFAGIIVDAISQRWYGFADTVIWYYPAINITQLPRTDTSADTARYVPPKPLGMIIQIQCGASYGATQAVIGPGHYGAGVGYRIIPWLALMANVAGNEYVDLTADNRGEVFDGDATVCNGTMRIMRPGGFYLAAGAGRAHLFAASVRGDVGNVSAADSAHL